MACNEYCHYGPAPHKCFYQIQGAAIGQSVTLPESEFPESYEPDPDNEGLGIHHDCGWTITKGHPMTTPKDEAIISIGYNKMDDGTYRVTMHISGLTSEAMAEAGVNYLMKAHCDREIAAEEMQ